MSIHVCQRNFLASTEREPSETDANGARHNLAQSPKTCHGREDGLPRACSDHLNGFRRAAEAALTMAFAAAQAETRSQSAPRWILWAQAAIGAGIVLALYTGTAVDLAADWWTQPEASHGILIPPLAFYMAYMRRGVTLAIPATRDSRGLLLSAAACLMYIFGRLAAEFFLTRMSIVVLLAGLVCTFWGMGRLRALAFPLILLATMVPLPGIIYNSLAAPLQLFASTIATDLAQLLGRSIYREGNIIHLAGVSLGVAEACSGLHSLSALLVGSLLLGFVADGGKWSRVLLVMIALPLAVAVNVLRVTGTAILADIRLEFALGFYHSFSGWLVFVLGFGCLWLIGKLVIRPRKGAE